MARSLDLRDESDSVRTRLFDAFDDAERGDRFEVFASRDVDPSLVRYQIERDRELAWAYAHPDEEPRELDVVVQGPLDGYGSVDVRDLKPQRRHEVLLGAFDELAVDEGFVLVNDHDPKPLYHELQSMHGDVVGWEYRSRGADGWRVQIWRTGASDTGEDEVDSRYDVREIPKPERHPTIHHRYGMLPEGATMELIAPHEPRPLLQEFRQQYGDSFDWAVVEREPGAVRVRVTKETDAGEGNAGASAAETAEGDAGSLDVVEELDVRDLPPAERHERIFEAYDDLASGTGFVLVNDHDPKPLYHQFEAEAGPEFSWEYRRRDPGEFRVLVGKADVSGDDSTTVRSDAPF